MMNVTEKKVGKRKSKMRTNSPESEQPPNKKYDSPRSLSGDEAYCTFSQYSYQSFRGDETDGSSVEDILEIDEDEQQAIAVESLKINYKYLIAEMEPQGIMDHLHQTELFSDKILEECKETPNRRRRNDLLIKEVYHIAQNKESKVLQIFASALNKTDQSFIVDHLRTQPPDLPAKYKRSALQRFIVGMKDRIVDNVEPKDFIDDLVVSKAISFHEHEDITRLDLRRKRIAVIMEKMEQGNSSSWKIKETIADTYPKLFAEFKRKSKKTSSAGDPDDQSKGGAAVSIRLNLKGHRDTQRRRYFLREIEQRTVRTFNIDSAENIEMMNDLVEECRCIFEGLKISSVVIQLLTRDQDSLKKVLKKIRSGKAVNWLMSMLNENDKHILRRLRVKTLQISVSVDENGNLDSLRPVQDCICRLNKENIRQNKEKLAAILTDVESLLPQMYSFGVPVTRLKSLLLADNGSKKSTILMDFFVSEDIPRVCFCLLEEHIKSNDPSSFESLFINDSNEKFEPLKSDIKQHEEFLKEELEVHTFLPIIRSWENEKSVRLLAKLSGCPGRISRVEEFIRFLLSERDLTWFWEEVKKKHRYIWETVTSSMRTVVQSKSDFVAVKLMNDTVVDDVDPSRLKQYLKEETLLDLGFCDFEKIRSRKSQAQFMMNRLSTNTICEFMVALRRSGYEHICQQIKAGSFAKQYVCPRIHSSDSRKGLIYKKRFDITAELNVNERSFRRKNPVPTNRTEDESYLPPSTSYFIHVDSKEPSLSLKSDFRRPVSVGSIKDSESGIFSGPDDPVYDIANKCDFDDEGISSCSPAGSLDLDTHVTKPKTKTGIRSAQKKSFKSEKKEKKASVDGDGHICITRFVKANKTSTSTCNNESGIDTMEGKTESSCETLPAKSSLLTDGENKKSSKEDSIRKRAKGLTRSMSEKVSNKKRDVKECKVRMPRSRRRLMYLNDADEVGVCCHQYTETCDRTDGCNNMLRNMVKLLHTQKPTYNENGDDSTHDTLERTQKGIYTKGPKLLAWPERSRINTPDFEEIKRVGSSPFLQVVDRRESAKKEKPSRNKPISWKHSSFVSKEEGSDEEIVISINKNGDESVCVPTARNSQKAKYTKGRTRQAWLDRSGANTPNFEETKRADPSDCVYVVDRKERDNEVKRTKKKSIQHSSFASKEGLSGSGATILDSRTSKQLYKRSLSDTMESGKHLKNIPFHVKSQSGDVLSAYFDTRCSMQTVHEERSVSSPPNDREPLTSHKKHTTQKSTMAVS